MTPYVIVKQYNPQLWDIPVYAQPGFLFNEGTHLRQQEGGFHLITALNQVTRQAEARCALFTRAEQVVSPGAAPFGSVEFTKALPEAVLDGLVQTIQETAQESGLRTLRLVNYPHCYAPEQASRLADTLLAQGFRLIGADQNQFLPVGAGSFERAIDPSERRRLMKCRRAGFRFGHWECPAIDEVLSFLQTTRQQQGYRLTIQPERLTHLLATFPDQFPVFAVWDGDCLAALAVAVRVRADILYNFLPASHSDYRTYSPMVMLTDGLFAYCQHHQIRLLDLGISVDSDRQPKLSLMRFKRNLGALDSPKLVFEKAL
ncbi:hypothetical protein BN8_05146 [Fibrisoma limi BUZ 3]|uniref:BioF2-like acetyltransferase domain-containing protein n=1 Tax=Fibrisoma limi BUZ 3 TaxID=1185876 RepID=I2GPM5_9BACT|nr:GNAT family N-acetyltransferase [Fibrisoma limi]CCH55853.1 hypothetical protein BN8_05146 [Fibrisoma limi BUZ 3]